MNSFNTNKTLTHHPVHKQALEQAVLVHGETILNKSILYLDGNCSFDGFRALNNLSILLNTENYERSSDRTVLENHDDGWTGKVRPDK